MFTAMGRMGGVTGAERVLVFGAAWASSVLRSAGCWPSVASSTAA